MYISMAVYFTFEKNLDTFNLLRHNLNADIDEKIKYSKRPEYINRLTEIKEMNDETRIQFLKKNYLYNNGRLRKDSELEVYNKVKNKEKFLDYDYFLQSIDRYEPKWYLYFLGAFIVPAMFTVLLGEAFLFPIFLLICAPVFMFLYGYSCKDNAEILLQAAETLKINNPEIIKKLRKIKTNGFMWMSSAAVSGYSNYKNVKTGFKNIYSNKGDRSY